MSTRHTKLLFSTVAMAVGRIFVCANLHTHALFVMVSHYGGRDFLKWWTLLYWLIIFEIQIFLTIMQNQISENQIIYFCPILAPHKSTYYHLVNRLPSGAACPSSWTVFWGPLHNVDNREGGVAWGGEVLVARHATSRHLGSATGEGIQTRVLPWGAPPVRALSKPPCLKCLLLIAPIFKRLH